MKLITAAKRQIAAAVLVAGATCLGLASLQATEPCPLPEDYDTTTTTTTTNDNSPGQEGGRQYVLHNGKLLCLPAPAVAAHVRHGDTQEGPCTKPGNNTPGA